MALVIKEGGPVANYNKNGNLAAETSYLLGSRKATGYIRTEPVKGGGPLKSDQAIADVVVKAVGNFIFKLAAPSDPDYQIYRRLRATPFSLEEYLQAKNIIDNVPFFLKVENDFNRDLNTRLVISARKVFLGAKVDLKILGLSSRKLEILQSSLTAEMEVLAVAELAYDALDRHIISLEKQKALKTIAGRHEALSLGNKKNDLLLKSSPLIPKKDISSRNTECCTIL